MNRGTLPTIEIEEKPRSGASSDSAQAERLKLMRAQRAFYTVLAMLGCIALIGVVVFLMDILAVPLGILIWTVIFVFCLRGIVNGLEDKGVSRGLGTTIAFVVMALVLGGVFMLMCSPALGLGEQFVNLIESIPGYIQQLISWGNEIYGQYREYLENEALRQWATEALGSVSIMAQELVKGSATSVIGVGNGIANALLIIGFALVVAFWVLMELPAMGREFKRLVDPKYHEDLELFHVTLTNVLGGYIRATLVQCAIIGAVCLVLYMFAGVPNFAALGVITGILNIIPVIGPALGGIAAAVFALFVSPVTALIVLIGTLIIQQFVYTFVSPKLMASSVDVHPALTLICLMAGSALGGAMGGLVGSIFGMLVSIPAVAVFKAIFVYYFEKSTGRQLVSEDGVFFQGTPSEGEGVDPMADATSPHPGSTAKFAPIDISKMGERMQTAKFKPIDPKDVGKKKK